MARKERVQKTNAMRELERGGVDYKAVTFEEPEVMGRSDLGVQIAHMLGYDPAQGFKTLVCEAPHGDHVVCCIPSAAELDLKKAATAAGEKSLSLMLVPFAMYLIVFSPELVAILGAGRFTESDVSLTVAYLQGLALGLPFYGVNTYLQKVCSSLRRMGLFALACTVAGVIQVAFCLALTPVLGLWAVSLCSLIYFATGDVITFVILRRAVGSLGLAGVAASCVRALGLGLAGSVVGVGAVFALERLVAPLSGSVMQAIAYCVAGGVPALLVTFGIAVALDLSEASFVSTIVRRVVRR